MRFFGIFIIGIISLLFVQCSKSESPEEKVISLEKSQQKYYPASFKNDNRINIISGLKEEINQIFKKRSEDMHYPGLAYGIVVDDSLIMTGQMGTLDIESNIPATPKSLFRIASMSKSFTAMTILHLRDEGKVFLDDPVSKYIPEMGNLTSLTKDSPEITLRNLLTMTAGFPEDNPWGDRQLDATDEELIDFIAGDVSFSSTPSTGYEYSNLGFALLGNVITRVTGMPYQKYITETIFKPLKMSHTVWEYSEVADSLLAKGYRWEDARWKAEPLLHDGAYGSMGGIITSIEDFSRYVSFHLSAWPTRNEEERGPVKRSSVREMHQMHNPGLTNNGTGLNGQFCSSVSGYGFGLRITNYCEGSWSAGHGGALPGFASYYLFYPEYGIGIMAFCNLTYTSPASAINKVAARIFQEPAIEPRELPVSDILAQRKGEVYKLITSWDEDLEEEIVAMNLYLDKSRESRMEDAKNKLAQIGKVISVGEIKPLNQLRGTFEIFGETDTLHVFFTLNPEKSPKVQRLDMW